jgi:NitT/TauT family transport system permease protein
MGSEVVDEHLTSVDQPIAGSPVSSTASVSRRDAGVPGSTIRSGRRRVGTRGRREHPLFRIRGGLGLGWRIALGVAGIAIVLAFWWVLASVMDNRSVLPTPPATVSAIRDLWRQGILTHDLWASVRRILIGYGASMLIGIVVGISIGTWASIEALTEAPIGFLRYIPASALTPVLLLWLGIGESPKVWLIIVGTVFFNILMVADVARAVPRELLDAAYTLGAGRFSVVRRVIARHSMPGIIDVARINLAAAWLMLVVAELLAAQEGLAFQIVRAQRFRAVDTMFGLLIVFGVIGLVSDLGLRWLRNVSAPWARP